MGVEFDAFRHLPSEDSQHVQAFDCPHLEAPLNLKKKHLGHVCTLKKAKFRSVGSCWRPYSAVEYRLQNGNP